MKQRVLPIVTTLIVLWGLLICVFSAAEKPLLKESLSFSTAVTAEDGELLRLALAEDERYRLWLPLEKFAPTLLEATLFLEDRWFFYHPGFNPIALIRGSIRSYLLGDRLQGASTITMQLARLRYKLNTRSIPGKLNQIWHATLLEWHYSKKEILEAYLNLAPYGGNIEGAAAASMIYFEKSPHELTAGESFLLAVLPQSPSRRTPFAGPEAMQALNQAKNLLLQRYRQSYPDAIEHFDSTLKNVVVGTPESLPFLAPHFVDELLRHHQTRSIIHSSLSLPLQRELKRKVDFYIQSQKSSGVSNASALIVDTRSMEIKALVGSANFFDEKIDGQVDGTRGKRSPGSTLKPFIYGLAIDQGLIHPKTMLKDAPRHFGAWSPENFDQQFSGPIDATTALIRSRNIPAVDLARRLGPMDLYDFLSKANIKGLRSRDHYGLALVLGGGEITMREMAALYAALANQGRPSPLKSLHGEAPKKVDFDPPLLSPEASELVLSMLEENPRPGSNIKPQTIANHVPVAWKTGTSYGFRDAWAVGVVGPYVLVTWVGNFDGQGHPIFTGRKTAGKLFFSIVDGLKSQGLPPTPIVGISKIKQVKVCSLSGMLPNKHCQHTIATDFIPGKSPIQKCRTHRMVAVDSNTGLRSCPQLKDKKIQRLYEFWPSDLLALFKQAGLPRRTPPPLHPQCGIGQTIGVGPEITSPKQNVTYQIRVHQNAPTKIPLAAVSEGDVKKIYWFANHEFLGEVDSNKTLYWTARQGKFRVIALDDQGRHGVRELEVEGTH
jgi:penicillin-binding protein 1C